MSASKPAWRRASRRLMLCPPMASRRASLGMTWSTRTGEECTGAPLLAPGPRRLPAHLGQAGEVAQRPPPSQLPRVDTVVRRPQERQVTATVPIGPQEGRAGAVPHQALRLEMRLQAGDLLGPPAIPAVVAAGEVPVRADGESGGDDGVHPEPVAGRADGTLRGGR